MTLRVDRLRHLVYFYWLVHSRVAQLVEQVTVNHRVRGSSPLAGAERPRISLVVQGESGVVFWSCRRP
jgi:hypothetical protein